VSIPVSNRPSPPQALSTALFVVATIESVETSSAFIMKIAVKDQHLHVSFDNDIAYYFFYLLDLRSKTLNYIVLPPVKTILLNRGHKNDSETFHQKVYRILVKYKSSFAIFSDRSLRSPQ